MEEFMSEAIRSAREAEARKISMMVDEMLKSGMNAEEIACAIREYAMGK